MVKRAGERPQKVAWFELFYDLVAVAAIAQVGKVFLAEPTYATTFLVLGSVVVLFTIWLLTTLVYGLVPSDPMWRKGLVLIQMVTIVVAALAVGREGLPNWVGFTSIAAGFATMAIIYARTRGAEPVVTQSLRRLVPFISLAVVMFLAAAAVSLYSTSEQAQVWVPVILLLTMAVILVPVVGPFMRDLMRAKMIDIAHFEERFGLLIIIVLGESFISLITSLSQAGEIPSVGFFVLTFVVTFSVWSIYFLTVMPAGVPEVLGNLRVWVLAHPILVFAAVTVSTEFADLSRIDFSENYVTEAVEWSPFPILLVLVTILVMMASQQHKGRLDTKLAKSDIADYSKIRTKLIARREQVLQTQTVAVVVVGGLFVLDWFRPETGVPWYSVAAALVIAVDAIVLALLGRVK